MKVIRKILLMFEGDSEKDWWRTSIFHFMCTIKDKVCNLGTDNGSFENIVLKKIVKKL